MIKKSSVDFDITVSNKGGQEVKLTLGASRDQAETRVIRAGDTVRVAQGLYFGMENESKRPIEFEIVVFKK